MKFATKPRRSSRCQHQQDTDQHCERRRNRDQARRHPRRQRPARFCRRQDRDGGGGADAERARGAQQRVDDHRHDGRVEADLQREPGDGRIGHRLRDDDSRRRQPGKEVEPQPRRLICPQPCDRGNQGGANHRVEPARIPDGEKKSARVQGAQVLRCTCCHCFGQTPRLGARGRLRSARTRRAQLAPRIGWEPLPFPPTAGLVFHTECDLIHYASCILPPKHGNIYTGREINLHTRAGF